MIALAAAALAVLAGFGTAAGAVRDGAPATASRAAAGDEQPIVFVPCPPRSHCGDSSWGG